MNSTDGRVAQLIRCLSVVCIVALLSACSAKPEDAIIGTWQRTPTAPTDASRSVFNAGEIAPIQSFEFLKGGNVIVGNRFGSCAGTYEYVDGNRIKLQCVDATTALIGELVKVSVSGEKLSLTYGDGRVQEYTRVK